MLALGRTQWFGGYDGDLYRLRLAQLRQSCGCLARRRRGDVLVDVEAVRDADTVEE